MKNFKEWFLYEMAMLAKQGIEISTPENIEYLQNIPKNMWVTALCQKYGEMFVNYINNGQSPNTITFGNKTKKTIPINPNLESLAKQLEEIGVDIHGMSGETMTGESLNLPNERTVRRWMSRWLTLSYIERELDPETKQKALSGLKFDKTGWPANKNNAQYVKESSKNYTAKDLVPNIGVKWNVNAMEAPVNSYDDQQQQNQALWDIAPQLGLKSPQEVEAHVKEFAKYYANRKPDLAPNAELIANDVFKLFMNNLKTISENPDQVKMRLYNLTRMIIKRYTRANGQVPTQQRGAINSKRANYNQQQIDTNFAKPTQDPYSLADDPNTYQNRKQVGAKAIA